MGTEGLHLRCSDGVRGMSKWFADPTDRLYVGLVEIVDRGCSETDIRRAVLITERTPATLSEAVETIKQYRRE